MTLTWELVKPFRKSNKTYYIHQLRMMGLETETKGWVKRLVGAEVKDEDYEKAYNSIKVIKGRIGLKKDNRKVRRIRSQTLPVVKCSEKDTKAFIIDYIENMTSETIYGGLVPEWIHSNVSWEAVKIRLMRIPYSAFLKTYYWRAITMYLKHKNGDHCTYCSAETGLQVHHKTYDHHGIELFYMDELEVLCDKCHKARH